MRVIYYNESGVELTLRSIGASRDASLFVAEMDIGAKEDDPRHCGGERVIAIWDALTGEYINSFMEDIKKDSRIHLTKTSCTSSPLVPAPVPVPVRP